MNESTASFSAHRTFRDTWIAPQFLTLRKLASVTITACLAIAVVGCSSTATQVAGFKDPAYSSRSFSKPAVYALGPDLVWRKAIEEGIVSELSTADIPAEAVVALIPPTRLTSSDGRENVVVANLRDKGVDALIVVEIESQSGGGWKPLVVMKTRVVDVQSGDVAWVADSRTGGNAFASLADARSAYCKAVVAEMIAQGVVRSPSKSTTPAR